MNMAIPFYSCDSHTCGVSHYCRWEGACIHPPRGGIICVEPVANCIPKRVDN